MLKTVARTILIQRNLRCISTQSTSSALRSPSIDTKSSETNKLHENPEVAHHERMAKEWWHPNGPMKALHAYNELRVPFIRDGLIARGTVSGKLCNTSMALLNQKILEVGCGGGILTEQLARLGADVTGIDLSDELINTARTHLKNFSAELQHHINYKIETVQSHAQLQTDYYDAVVVSEVIEHVDDKVALLEAAVQTLKPGGSIFITTLNQTWLMWICGIAIGEYVLGIAPRGTHHWDKLISPLAVQRILHTLDCQTVLVNGSTYDFWRNRWRWINSTQMCYALQAIKRCA